MVVNSILSRFQLQSLDLFKKTNLANKFYLAGGTALAEFYLRHRKSEDLDFFTNEELNLNELKKFSSKIQSIQLMDKIEFQHGFGLYTFFFYPRGEVAKYKIDFGQYPFETIKPLKKINGLLVEDLYDIAVDKAHTISVRPRSRDFIDLYFILKQHSLWNFKDLLVKASEKFEIGIDPLQLGENILQVNHLEDLPIMLKTLDMNKVRQYFMTEAKKLKQEVFV